MRATRARRSLHAINLHAGSKRATEFYKYSKPPLCLSFSLSFIADDTHARARARVNLIPSTPIKTLNAPWYVTNGTLHHRLNVPYVRDEIKKLGRRYADRLDLEEHSKILATDLTSDAETHAD